MGERGISGEEGRGKRARANLFGKEAHRVEQDLGDGEPFEAEQSVVAIGELE